MNPTFNPDFIQVPHQIYTDKTLSKNDLLIYGLVYWYTKLKNGKCTASNRTIANILGVTTRTVSQAIGRLNERGYVKAVYGDRTRQEIIPLVFYNYDANSLGGRNESSNGIEAEFSGDRKNVPQNKNINKNINNNNKNTIAKRIIPIYTSFWKDVYDTPYEVTNYGKITNILKPLDKLNDWQLVSLVWLHFNWYGASGSDEFAHKRLSEAFFPLEWIPKNINGYKTYLINTLDVKWDDENAVKKFILPKLKKVGYEIS